MNILLNDINIYPPFIAISLSTKKDEITIEKVYSNPVKYASV